MFLYRRAMTRQQLPGLGNALRPLSDENLRNAPTGIHTNRRDLRVAGQGCQAPVDVLPVDADAALAASTVVGG